MTDDLDNPFARITEEHGKYLKWILRWWTVYYFAGVVAYCAAFGGSCYLFGQLAEPTEIQEGVHLLFIAILILWFLLGHTKMCNAWWDRHMEKARTEARVRSDLIMELLTNKPFAWGERVMAIQNEPWPRRVKE